jgi:hypothetical protein
MAPSPVRRAVRRRAQERGAAMAEAAIVMLVLVVFWGSMALAYSGGRAKLDAQQSARVAVMYHASHECKQSLDEAPVSTAAEQGFDPGTGDLGDSGDFARGAPLDGPAFSDRSTFFFASASAQAGATLVGRSSSKESESWAVCNEGAYDGDLFGLAAYGYDFFKDLLPGFVQQILP